MFSASNSTTGAARLFFMSFSMLGSLIFAQLVIGMVMSILNDLRAVGSPQVFSLLAPFFVAENNDVTLNSCQSPILVVHPCTYLVHGTV